jgi:hypothetical protein
MLGIYFPTWKTWNRVKRQGFKVKNIVATPPRKKTGGGGSGDKNDKSFNNNNEDSHAKLIMSLNKLFYAKMTTSSFQHTVQQKFGNLCEINIIVKNDNNAILNINTQAFISEPHDLHTYKDLVDKINSWNVALLVDDMINDIKPSICSTIIEIPLHVPTNGRRIQEFNINNDDSTQ